MNKKYIWVGVFFIYGLWAVVAINGIVGDELEKSYNNAKDNNYNIGTKIRFDPYTEDFVKYRENNFNETWLLVDIENNIYERFI